MADPKMNHAEWLRATFARNRRLYGGFRMEVDPAPQDPAPTDPTPTDPPQDPAPKADPPDDGKGGKDAILADLAKERDKRQGLEARISEMETTQQAQLDAIAKALGLKSEDTPPDPEALTAQVQAEQAKARTAALELAVYRNAAANEANPDLLLDSASFLRSLADVDPADADAVSAAIKAAVDGNALFKTSQIPPTPQFPGGPRSTPSTQAGSLGEAIANRVSRNH